VSPRREHKQHLDAAARAALRAAGDVEPNPLVGCVIVDPSGRIIGRGHHRRFGEPHAEIEALADCARRGHSPAGATVYTTLEPCNHHGKQPPCTDALIAAKVARVIFARHDPNPSARGGAERLAEAGIAAEFSDASPLATRLTDPFIKRITTGTPWVIAKWAQTIDGRVATRTGQSQWISSEASRRMVHRLRSRVDAVLTGIGTVKADNPLLTARKVPRLRRVARRVVVDPLLETPATSALVRSISRGGTDGGGAPLTIACAEMALSLRAEARDALIAAGAEIVGLPGQPERLDLTVLLRHLAQAHQASNVLVEAGPGLVGSLVRDQLIDEAVVFIAPMLMADEHARPLAAGHVAPWLSDARRYELVRMTRRGPDAVLVYRRPI
jgi:diaminohydroxyphosphoribosylaminopyrimidine deaminase/5-amino-6-(5-phosphoribosylamino)uracil reductase